MQREGRGRTPGAALPRGTVLRLAAGLALFLLAGPAAASALECPAPPWGEARLESIPAERRIADLRASLDAGRPGAKAWSMTWGVVDGALTVGQIALIPFAEKGADKWVLGAGAFSSALGVVQIIAVPIVPGPSWKGDESCAELARLESALQQSARNVELGTGVVAHVANFAINLALGIAAGFADRRVATGALTFGIGVGIGEAQILTTPKAYPRAFERYRKGEVEAASPEGIPPRITVRVAPPPSVAREAAARGAVIAIALAF